MWDECLEDECDKKEKEQYLKVVFESKPIGEYGIILYLTTFDLEAFNKNKNLKEIPTRKKAVEIDIDRSRLDFQYYLNYIQKQLENIVTENYANEIKSLKTTIENMRREKITPLWNADIKKYGDVSNCESVVCDTIKGDVINCSNVKCNKIEGDTINCKFR